MSLCLDVIAALKDTDLLWRFRQVDGDYLFTVHGEGMDSKYLVNGYLQFYVNEVSDDWKIRTVEKQLEHSFQEVKDLTSWLAVIRKTEQEPKPIDKKAIDKAYGLGRKDDSSKLRWDLIPTGVLGQVIKVLTFGASKYSDDNWKKVPDRRRRYYAAMMRHVDTWWQGEKIDPESGVHHLAHAICCAMFLLWEDSDGTV